MTHSIPHSRSDAGLGAARSLEATGGADPCTLLSHLFPLDALDDAQRAGLVTARAHPSEALTILNYTERCQYERGLWSPVTLQCRGLIHDAAGRVVARPFRKFFNYGQSEGGSFAPDAPVITTDKLDGSLGILYPSATGWAIATRGSFDSDQARHATAVLRTRYRTFTPPVGFTLCFEIIYPQNRIVLDYGALDDLVLLGAVHIATGATLAPPHPELQAWPGRRTDVLGYPTLRAALDAPMRQNAEGIVVHFLGSDERLKLKQADYVALHKIVTGLNERTVWQHLCEGQPLAALLAGLPDEFHEWVGAVAARIMATVDHDAARIEQAYATIIASLPPGYSRKDFALVAKDSAWKSELFARLAGKDYRPALLTAAKPSARLGPSGLASLEPVDRSVEPRVTATHTPAVRVNAAVPDAAPVLAAPPTVV